MEKIEITDEIINKVAVAEFKKWTGKKLKDQPINIKVGWTDNSREMLENYNRVVEILSE